jgi:UDP-glucose 4-epimerase
MKHKRVLVTGGAGFIGSHLVQYLVENDNEVIVVDILLRGNKINPSIFNKITFYDIDVRNKERILEISKGCDYIFHLAAVLGVDVVADNPVETMETEAIGMINIAEAAIKNGVKKVIYASTSGVYGHSAVEKSVHENIQLDPRTSYAIAKRYNEIYLLALYEEKGLNSISLRFFNVYGLNQDNRMVIPRFFEQAISNNDITIFGSGMQTRDFTYIDDVIKATIMLADKVTGAEIFNIANENEVTIKELAETIKRISGSSSKIVSLDSPQKRYDFEVERRFGSSEKLHKFIGFKPNSNLEDNLKYIFNEKYKQS